MSVNLSWWWRK